MPINQQPLSATSNSDALVSVYKEICANIRATDDISFNILRAVPFLSAIGSGALAFLPTWEMFASYPAFAVIGISLVGAAVTLGLSRWERRNIQTCRWLISRAAKLERDLFPGCRVDVQFGGMAAPAEVEAATMDNIVLSAKPFADWGKRDAAKFIYRAALCAWLIPIMISLYGLSKGQF